MCCFRDRVSSARSKKVLLLCSMISGFDDAGLSCSIDQFFRSDEMIS